MENSKQNMYGTTRHIYSKKMGQMLRKYLLNVLQLLLVNLCIHICMYISALSNIYVVK